MPPGRLQKLLANQLRDDRWAGDQATQEAIAGQWRLAKHVSLSDERDRLQHARNLEDAAKTEDRVRTDHAGRYPVELLQNAQDACADAGRRGTVWFRVTDTALLVGNEGVPFTADRVQSLIRLGGTTKTLGDPEHHTIGYKGIGFTSVLELSSRPQIISEAVAFELNRNRALRELSRILGLPIKRAPSRYFPFPIIPEDWQEDGAEIDTLLAAGAVTVVRLPFGMKSREDVEEEIRRMLGPRTLLLMPAIDRIDLEGSRSWRRRLGRKIAGGQLHHIRSEDGELSSWLVAQRRVPVEARVVQALEDELWSQVASLHVLAAIPWANGHPYPEYRPLPAVHAYFPTEDSLGRALLVHGDFFLDSNRRRIQGAKAGGAVSDVVTAGIANLVGDLATAFRREMPSRMPELIACLAEQQPAQGYGEQVSSSLNGELASRPILRTVAGRVITPEEAKLLDTAVPAGRSRDFARMVQSIAGLVDPAFEQAAREWLRELGASQLEPHLIVRELDPGKALTYERALLAVESWWKAKLRWGERSVLQNARILRSSSGSWHIAAELCEPVPGVPPLPRGLERATYLPPKNARAADFVANNLGVQQLTPRHCVDLVFQALMNGSYGKDDSESKLGHDFAFEIFRKHPNAIRDHPDRGRTPVPVRSWRRGPSMGWQPATRVYFSRDWTGNGDLEGLYRRFGKREFLSAETPGNRRRLQEARSFYRTLGVASEPRSLTKSGHLRDAPKGWAEQTDVQEARRCPDGHPHTRRDYEFEVLDRLPELLDGIDTREAESLVSALARMREPMGTEAKVWCTHSGHRTAHSRRAIGMQRWLLETHRWVPVMGDPLGRDLVSPGEAWVDVNGKSLRACLAQAVGPRGAGAKLGWPSATRAEPTPIARALITLNQAYPQLDEAREEIVEGAYLLLQRLQAALHRQRDAAYTGPRPPFPAVKDGRPVWSDAPAVADIGLPPGVPLPVIPVGNWIDLQDVFELPSASTLIAITVTPLNAEPAELNCLKRSDRTGLAALLAAKGGDLKAISRRLSLLKVEKCESIRTTFQVEKSKAVVERRIYLQSVSDGIGTLYVVERLEPTDLRELASQLTSHLGVRDEADTVFYFLNLGEIVLRLNGVGSPALNEAEEAMNRYVRPEPAHPGETAASRPADRPSKEDGNKHDSGNPREVKSVFSPSTDPLKGLDSIPGTGSLGDRGSDQTSDVEDQVTFTKGGRKPAIPKGGKPSGARGGTGRSEFPTLSRASRREVELAAIARAKQYAVHELRCVDVRDVQEENRGWDLEFVFPEGERWPVEVKGFGASAGAFIITRNELDAATRNDNYLILLVTGLQRANGQVVPLKDSSSWMDAGTLKAMSWVVGGWRTHVDEVIDWVREPSDN